MNNNIFKQDGQFIETLHPNPVVSARIFSEEQREQIKQLLKKNYYPHHTSVGVGKSSKKHWNLEKYKGRFGTGFKIVTTSTYSSNFNHITYFIHYDL